MRSVFSIFLLTISLTFVNSQNTITKKNNDLENVINDNKKIFDVNGNSFTGDGWTQIKNKVIKSDNVLIGEDHFSNEIPFFIKSIAAESKFDNFYIELDPYSTKIIENSILSLSDKELKPFNNKYKELFSFYALDVEYNMLKDIVKSGTTLFGSDQIVMYADRLLLENLINESKNEDAKKIYKEIILKSKSHLNKFYENPKNPMYFVTSEFKEKIEELKKLNLPQKEDKVISAMGISADIYTSKGSHKKRIQLLKHYLIESYPEWKKGRTLFKYGAAHLARGESFFTIYDIGNLVANLSEANYKKSLHIAIVAQSGELGAPLKTFPTSKVNIEKGPLKSMQPFFDTDTKNWKVYDLINIEKVLNKQGIKIKDVTLNRLIKGYDLLVVVPMATPAKF